MTNRKLIDKIAEYFAEKPEVAAVYLFGSYARGREKEGSDVDLGILLDRDVSSDENDLRTTYLIDLARILRKDLHIVIMNGAGEGIVAQIFKHGKCIFQRNSRSLAGFRNLVVHEYRKIDLTKVYQIAHKDIDDLEEYLRAIFRKCGMARR